MMRTYRWLFDDNMNGLFNHRGSDLINRAPVVSRLVQLPRAKQMLVGRQASAVKLGKNFLKKLDRLGIK